jgi:type IV secretion/conjugal transfer VirB4 family ATPase
MSMQALQVFQDKTPGVADLLNWAALVDDGIVQGKDGSLLAGYYYRGKDIASATESERNYLTARVNAALSRLGSGWVTWIDAVRLPAADYPDPEASHFPDAISQLIEAERRTQFLAEGSHFESYYVLIFMFTPPLLRNAKVIDLFYEDGSRPEPYAERVLTQFQKNLTDIEDALGDAVKLHRMGGYTATAAHGKSVLRDELVEYLHFTLTGLTHPINIPPFGAYMDTYVGGQELWTGELPKIGEHFVCCVSIESFPPESYPNMLQLLENMPVAYRWSSRMIYLDQHESIQELKKYRRKWKQKVRGFFSQVFKTQGGMINEDALRMAGQAEAAITDASTALVAFGYYTPVLVLMGKDRRTLLDNARLLLREIQREGFACRMETLNTMEAWLGSIPGHPLPNIRRALIHTLNLADLLPLSSVWAGKGHAPCPFYPPEAPPLLHAATSGATPFRLNLHVGDVGHTLVFGPTGSGKSTLLATLIAQFRRYPQASICAFDKGRSLWAIVEACGGCHVDIAAANSPAFAPLSRIDTASDMAWAEEWIATGYELQAGMAPTPRQREEIHRAIRLLKEDKQPDERSLTDFLLTVQDETIRSALNPYTIAGTFGHLLDSRRDGLSTEVFTVLEIEELMSLGDKIAIPVLLYLFRRFEQSLTGQPALLVLDEAWVMLGHPVFREKIWEWLKVLRKANCAVVLATQSLSDAVHSGIFDVLIESCPTKILLPNEEADKTGTDRHPGPRDLYAVMGLNETEIGIIKTAIKKRHYYFISPEGRRLFDLGLGSVALSFLAVSDKEQLRYLRALKENHGTEWPYVWLKEREVDYEALV